ncbi:putative aldouronate transport system permease protein [Lachnospiraceae bacterium PM6-15]|jgi:putative aldouronate transport system permease protein|uniref:ABC transporter permease n=1 Tax=Ohessyouella blattaphilus TaxID=2949333 RepID=UPI003E25F4FD
METQIAPITKGKGKVVKTGAQKSFSERLKVDLKQNWILYLMALPAIIYFIVYCYAPMAGLYIAFSDFKISGGIFTGEFVGFKHLINFFHSHYFGRLLRNTLVLSLETLAFGFPIPIIFALVLNEIQSKKFKKLAQTVTYMPHFISIVVICGLVVDFFSINGLINTIIQAFGVQPIAFLSDPKWFRTVYVGSEVWQNFGWDSVVFIAALTGIDLEQFEAAKLDGASRWKTIWHISLPSILPTIVTMLLMRIGHVMSIGFEKVFNLYSPATYETADIISTFVYRQGILGANFSSAASIGLFNSVINLILVVMMNKISRKLTESSLW